MSRIWFKAVPFDKKLVLLALESGVDAIVADKENADNIRALGIITVHTPEDLTYIAINGKSDEEKAAAALKNGEKVVLSTGWEIIPVENILARSSSLAVEVASLEQAVTAAGILEKGVETVVVLPEAAKDLKKIVTALKLSREKTSLEVAEITAIKPVGLAHRVCVDTCSMLRTGQGMLIGNSSAFTFLVHAETEDNPYVAARPFRINAGAVHAYAVMPGDRTNYLEELAAGREVLIVDYQGNTSVAIVGRVKVEVRPMLLITARTAEREGAIFLQNAETIRMTQPDGKPVSVVSLREGDKVLCRTDLAGRHFGMRITEDIKEH